MPSSASCGVASSGVTHAGDMARARRTCNTSMHLIVAATIGAASSGEADLVALFAAISSKACNEEKSPLFVHREDPGGSTGSAHIVSHEL